MPTRKTTVFYVLLIAMASAAIGMIIASRLDLSPASSAQTMAAPPPMNSAPIAGPIDAQTFRQIAAAQSPIVVNIRTESRRKTQELTDFFGGGGDDLLRRFFGAPEMPGQRPRQPREEVTEGAGTGFIIDPAGLILTNNHVIEGATKVEVALFPAADGSDDGETFDARVVGRDPLTDSALIELVEKPARKLPAARFGDSDQMMPGDWVMAIGNPFNLAHTVTVGIISAKGRPFPVAEGRSQQVLQTDAAINPGNSGGPLLNIRGEVIGINTAILSNERGGASNLGIGFAIPINAVRELLPQLREGKITRGRIGVQIRGIQPEAVEGLGLKNRRGALVTSVEPNSPGARAGVQRGDVVLEFNGKPVASTDELVAMVVRTRPGTTVPVKIIRNGQERTVNVTVEELNLDQEARQADAAEPDTTTGFGMTLQDLTPDMARRLRMPSGTDGAIVSDLEPRGPAAQGGVQPGDVILEVNRTPVASASEASRELSRVDTGKAAFLVVWRRGQEVFLTVIKE